MIDICVKIHINLLEVVSETETMKLWCFVLCFVVCMRRIVLNHTRMVSPSISAKWRRVANMKPNLLPITKGFAIEVFRMKMWKVSFFLLWSSMRFIILKWARKLNKQKRTETKNDEEGKSVQQMQKKKLDLDGKTFGFQSSKRTSKFLD